jgi:nucleoside-diphosphate kinase
MAIEQTLILVKPDGVRRGLVGEVIGRIERKGYTLEALELRTLDVETAEQHYGEHVDKPFFRELVDFITSAPLVAMCVSGERRRRRDARADGRHQPARRDARVDPRRLRHVIGENIVHGSDSPESAERELGLFFPGRF